MTTTLVSAIPSLEQWQRQVSRLFDGTTASNEWTPRTDIFESEQGLSLQFDLPGVKRDSLEIQTEKGLLTIKGERKLDASPEAYHRIERPYGTFTRVFSLPEYVNAEGIEARLSDGVLTLSLPRREESKPKQITVQIQS